MNLRNTARLVATVAASLAAAAALTFAGTAFAHDDCEEPGCAASESYHGMPEIAAIGVRTGKYVDIPESEPEQRTLMAVDVKFPGWMPWRRLALAQDVPGYFAQVKKIKSMDFDWLVSVHVARVGTRADVVVQHEFLEDLKAAAAKAALHLPAESRPD